MVNFLDEDSVFHIHIMGQNLGFYHLKLKIKSFNNNSGHSHNEAEGYGATEDYF